VAGGENAGQYPDHEDQEDHQCSGNLEFPEQKADGHGFRILQGEHHHQNQQPQPGIKFDVVFNRSPSPLEGVRLYSSCLPNPIFSSRE